LVPQLAVGSLATPGPGSELSRREKATSFGTTVCSTTASATFDPLKAKKPSPLGGTSERFDVIGVLWKQPKKAEHACPLAYRSNFRSIDSLERHRPRESLPLQSQWFHGNRGDALVCAVGRAGSDSGFALANGTAGRTVLRSHGGTPHAGGIRIPLDSRSTAKRDCNRIATSRCRRPAIASVRATCGGTVERSQSE
jgi:hypothetical protein